MLAKAHVISLQCRGLLVTKVRYPLGQKDSLIPGFDLANEIVALST